MLPRRLVDFAKRHRPWLLGGSIGVVVASLCVFWSPVFQEGDLADLVEPEGRSALAYVGPKTQTGISQTSLTKVSALAGAFLPKGESMAFAIRDGSLSILAAEKGNAMESIRVALESLRTVPASFWLNNNKLISEEAFTEDNDGSTPVSSWVDLAPLGIRKSSLCIVEAKQETYGVDGVAAMAFLDDSWKRAAALAPVLGLTESESALFPLAHEAAHCLFAARTARTGWVIKYPLLPSGCDAPHYAAHVEEVAADFMAVVMGARGLGEEKGSALLKFAIAGRTGSSAQEDYEHASRRALEMLSLWTKGRLHDLSLPTAVNLVVKASKYSFNALPPEYKSKPVAVSMGWIPSGGFMSCEIV